MRKTMEIGVVPSMLIAIMMAVALLTGWWYDIAEWFGEWVGILFDNWFSKYLEQVIK